MSDGRAIDSSPAITRNRVLALLEVTCAFALMHVGFRAFKRFTSLGRLEHELDFNLSPGLVMIAVAVVAIRMRRRTLASHGITCTGGLRHANVALVSIVVVLTIAGVAYALGMRRDPTWSDPSLGIAACLLTLFASWSVVFALARTGRRVDRLPRWCGVACACALPLLPILVRLVQGRPVDHTSLVVLSIVIGAALGESVFFHGYVQARLNEVFGRPWRMQGVAFGPALLVTAAFFGLVHLLNPYDYFRGQGHLAWWWAAQSASSLYFGLLREKSGSIVATAVLHGSLNLASRLPGLLSEA